MCRHFDQSLLKPHYIVSKPGGKRGLFLEVRPRAGCKIMKGAT